MLGIPRRVEELLEDVDFSRVSGVMAREEDRVMAGTGGTSCLQEPLLKEGLGGAEGAEPAELVVMAVEVVELEKREDFERTLRATGGVVDIFNVGLFASE